MHDQRRRSGPAVAVDSNHRTQKKCVLVRKLVGVREEGKRHTPYPNRQYTLTIYLACLKKLNTSVQNVLRDVWQGGSQMISKQDRKPIANHQLAWANSLSIALDEFLHRDRNNI